ncbi:hypothetical protein ACN28S_55815 [Cystobacter fuscus]
MTQAASRVRISAETALESYQYQQQTNRKHWVVSPVVHLFGRVQDPGPELNARVTEVRQATDAVRARLAASHLSGALTYLLRAKRASEEARDLWRRYQEGIINRSDAAVTTLEFTRNASFITLGVLATIGTGGLGFTATTTAFGIELGATTALATVNKLFQRLGGNPAVQRLGANLFSRIVSSVVVFEGTTVFREVVDAVYLSLRGQPITWRQFEDRLVSQLLDPKGLFFAILMGAVQTHADRRYGSPRDFVVVDRNGRPVGNPDEMRGGVLYEDKSAAGLNFIPPGKAAPQQTPQKWAERQIHDATVNRLQRIPAEGVGTLMGATPEATRSVPALSDVLPARKYVFRIEGDGSALRSAVNAQLARLRAAFPGWTFSAEFGYRPRKR